MDKYRLNSVPGEITRDKYIRIDNRGSSAEDVARLIKETYLL
jgi:hypothetical protein